LPVRDRILSIRMKRVSRLIWRKQIKSRISFTYVAEV